MSQELKDSNKLIRRLDKLVLGSIPVIGRLEAMKDEERLNDEIAYIKEILLDAKVQIQRLEQRIDDEYTFSKEYKNFIQNTVRRAINDLRKEKIKLFANIIVNAGLEENVHKDYNHKYLYLDTIDKIDENLFYFLCALKSRCVTKGEELGVGWTGKELELKQMGVYDDFRFNADFLSSLGVIVRIRQERVIDKSLEFSEEYYVTEYGTEFINFVSEQGESQFTDVEEV